jgi:ribonuclease Z
LLTHFHSDHTVGVPDIWLTGWLESHFGTPFQVIGPPGAKALMSGLQQAYAADINIRLDDEKLPYDGIACLVQEYDRDELYTNREP